MIIDEKTMQPPPTPPTTLSTLPAHLLLQIVHMTFPQTPDLNESSKERQRKTLYWLSVSLRLVNRALYVASMHVLRSTYLPAYDSLIRSPYSSDPFPLPTSPQSPFASTSNPADLRLGTLQRETATLDLFIAVKVREDVWADESELHLERDESFKDLFDHAQPRSRLEDLVRIYGVEEGVVAVSESAALAAPPSNAAPSPTSGVFRTPPSPTRSKGKQPVRARPIPFSSLAISFSPRRVGLLMGPHGRNKRTIVETERSRDELLEASATRLVRQLALWLRTEGCY
ncbi:hypothetical protein MIND_01300400 [Mycena indigotica]|uniref:Uncharacterized protein n=1 Tax=Mycena indigotica TaxID=2126181 RepID=A0A8H6S1A2_9AGAR|nr:uncharacterized protein MIND_01300400 [Mycena indigotica]KAF7290602.1 hypothetical protein MIND_01300400 [Mycena indigotica]